MLVASLLLSCCNAESKSVVTGPLIWNVTNIDLLRANTSYQKLYNHIIATSDSFCKLPPVAVTEKKKTFAPDKHYYCSIGTYWWPDPTNPNGKYVNKDGQTNPERNEFDAFKLGVFNKRCKYLSVAFYLTKDRKYYDAFIWQIRAWFIDEGTYMYPNLAYAQVIPGHNNNKGRSTGTIDAYTFNDIIESVRLVNRRKKMDNETINSLRNWFISFSSWLENGEFGTKLSKAQNNISLAYDVTLCNMYIFIGNENKAKKIVDDFKDKRIRTQIKDNGEQPAEIVRTKAFSYSLYNLKHVIDFSLLARKWQNDFYDTNCSLADNAFDYLLFYIDKPESFPYQQISSWDVCRKDLQVELTRRRRLTKKRLSNDNIFIETIPLESIDVLLK